MATRKRYSKAKRRRTIRRRKTRLSKKRNYRGGSVNQECPVCLEEKPLCLLSPCKHKMCQSCFMQMNRATCPLCRANIQYISCDLDQTTISEILDFLGDNWEYVSGDTKINFKYLLNSDPIIDKANFETRFSNKNLTFSKYKIGKIGVCINVVNKDNAYSLSRYY